ncbi:ADP-ribose glycohydrolase MACROD2 [Protopterus annectens]|uniref:ADP-ribose glycohydrolase MACROD2 n=1 Tax=Protopterus annectens TaxID=7888 RepID=UPI001CFAD76A|nr:ADP-ribose glycohydrolase MACROD2 [Protopterus annectens]
MQTNNKKKTPGWEEKKAQLLKMALEERRKEYHHRDYVPLENIPTWDKESQRRIQGTDGDVQDPSNVNDSLSSKVALYRGDITALEIDAIVNAGTTPLSKKKKILWRIKSIYRRRNDVEGGEGSTKTVKLCELIAQEKPRRETLSSQPEATLMA